MQITQSYAKASNAQSDADGMKFNFSAELSRKPVNITAIIQNSLAYARFMLSLRQVVKGDLRTPQKDNSAYQEWVMERYLEELPEHLKGKELEKVKLIQSREALKARKKELQKSTQGIRKEINQARTKYYNWLYQHDRDKWYVLDPVISVHPDAIIFEAFSLDESSYGRVTVPSNLLEKIGEVDYGTTNIDFSEALADEIYRVRSYRPAWLKVTYEQVELSTSAGINVEKKIDLPSSWVRGFLQVQSASTLDGIDLKLNSQTISNILAVLERKNEKEGPRSLKFILEKGKKIKVIIDPWNIEIIDTNIFEGDKNKEIKIWGRKRLFVLKNLLPYANNVSVKLLGTGMPSYWTLEQDGHRFDLGLSGWTDNDWAKKGNFDLLASTGSTKDFDIKQVEKNIIKNLCTTPDKLSKDLGISHINATTALQALAKEGQVMYDHLTQTYRWRQLLKKDINITETEEDERLKYAIKLVKEENVSILDTSYSEKTVDYRLGVQGKNFFKPKISLDADGRVKQAECSCSFYKSNKLRQGPCAHIMAGVLQITKEKNK